MEKIKFDPRELEPCGTLRPMLPTGTPMPRLNTPVSSRENFLAWAKGEGALWMPHTLENQMFWPAVVPDNIARAQVTDPLYTDPSLYGGKDMFGVEWQFEPQARGSMPKGAPLVPDIEEWETYVTFPDIETWDWQGCAERTASLRQEGRIIQVSQFNGLFERLISFCGMTDALIALVDEDCQEAVHRLFDRLCDLYDRLFEKYKQYFNADMVWFHDDWGSQRGPLISPDTVEEMLLPYLKRVADSAHRHGLLLNFHSCGKIEDLVPYMIEAGVDLWNSQDVNDMDLVLEKYGDRIKVAVSPKVRPGASPEEMEETVRRFVDTYAKTGCYIARSAQTTPEEFKLLYEYSRKAYCG